MKKALFIGIFSVLALAPLRCALAQASNNTPAEKAVEKSAAEKESSTTANRAMLAVSPPDQSSNPQLRESNNAPTTATAHSSDPVTVTAPITRMVNGDPASNKPAVSEDSARTDVYKVDVGDVLDIRLFNSPANRSTLYSVIEGGLIDLPIAGGPLQVAGLTTSEIQTRITSELKRLAVEQRTQVAVGVRQYASHAVVITGLVGSPGTRNLRREAVPLYVLLSEVQPRLDAARAAIMRTGLPVQVVELSDSAALNFLVRPGDVINLTTRPQEFYYIGGRVSYPGQKSFQPGITLVQAILAAGGSARNSVAELSREGTDGRLTSTKFNLNEIKSGKAEDPKLQSGDRIEVVH